MKAGSFWINAAQIASIFISANQQEVAIELAAGNVIRLNYEDAREFQKTFDAVTKKFKIS